MKLATKIFQREDWYVTSNYGERNSIITENGSTKIWHKGTDYGTGGEKWPQYAIEEGKILSSGTDAYGGKFVWVEYPRLNIKLLHYHLDSVKVKKDDNVKAGTLLGYTGKTGLATGVHLHLELYNLKTNKYENPHNYNYKEQSVLYKVGDTIVFTGYLHKDSYGSGRGSKKTNYQGNITKVNAEGTKPYHINSIGWISENDILRKVAISTEIKVGDTVTTIKTGKASSDGTGNNARKGDTAKVERINKNAKYPYLVGSIGWFKKDALKKKI